MKSNSYRIAATIVLAWFVAGVAEARPDEVSEAAVKSCRFLSQVDRSSGYGKNADWRSIAKTRAEQTAATIGASHIVFTDFRPVGAFNGEASARAYVCQ